MRNHFAYVRVSTVKQGQRGVSLQEQRAAIEQYAVREGLTITEWFEDRETAAKSGRTRFTAMLRRLRRGSAQGVLVHKIDRWTRNHRDWADLSDLIEAGVDVRFVTDNLDLTTRGGRLVADIQVAVAADFIRNLREETKKGLYGRLKQGLYPWAAPIGYLDNGGGKPKTIDPVRGHLVRDAFHLYASGLYSMHRLQNELTRRGLRTQSGKKITVSMLARMLKRPFYAGIVHAPQTGETWPGQHEPLVSPKTFRAVQAILEGRTNVRLFRHDFAYRRLLRCEVCGRFLVGERQKNNRYVYYRCHNRTCRGASVSEPILNDQFQHLLSRISLSDEEVAALAAELREMKPLPERSRDDERQALKLHLSALEERLDRLTDKFVDDELGKDTYHERRKRLVLDISQARQEVRTMERAGVKIDTDPLETLELLKSLRLSHFLGNPEERRKIVETVGSNFLVHRKKLSVELFSVFDVLANREPVPVGCPAREVVQKWAPLYAKAAKELRQTSLQDPDALRG